MKKQSLRPRSGSTPPVPVRHQFDHEVPTVIHHPEEKLTALARLTHRIVLDPGKYVTWAVGIAAVALAIVVATNWTSSARTKTSEVWNKLDSAKKPEDLVEVASQHPGTEASRWVLLLAANEYYQTAIADLPNNRDVAVPNLKKALDLFEKVASEAPKGSFQAPAAVLGKARCLEARNELAKAIEQYQLVAAGWPNSPEADQANQLAEALKMPDAASFYKELYAYSPTKVTLPPLGTERLDLPTRPGGASATTPGRSGALGKLPGPQLELTPPDISEIRPAPGADLPPNVFTPEQKATPKAPRS